MKTSDHLPLDFGDPAAPTCLSYGMGVDSTAMLIGLASRGKRPDHITFADTGSEKQATYDYLPVISAWLEAEGFPPVTVVRYQPKNFKNFPPYANILENCLTNATFPSVAFRRSKNCSLKWKVDPINKHLNAEPDVRHAIAAGVKPTKLIGFDDSTADRKRTAHANRLKSRPTFATAAKDLLLYHTRYPLQEWGWTREQCKATITAAGLPVPPKSACFICPNAKPAELHDFSPDELRLIVVLEARTKPRLRTIEGLWGNGCKGTRGATPKPGTMTQYIADQNLLDPAEVAALQRSTPTSITTRLEAHAATATSAGWPDFITAHFSATQPALDASPCAACTCS